MCVNNTCVTHTVTVRVVLPGNQKNPGMKGFQKLSRGVVISLEETLTGGQSFRWRRVGEGEYRGVAFNILWLLKLDPKKALYYKVLAELPYETGLEGPDVEMATIRMKVDRPKPGKSSSGTLYPNKYYDSLLCRYFRLDVDLDLQCDKWQAAHPHFRQVAKERAIQIRVLDQDPVENLFSFICSQNNHINRITSLVEKLATFYGTRIGDVDGETFYSFPTAAQMDHPDVEQKLRENGFGYRAKFIAKSAHEICEKGGLGWFAKLQDMDYKSAHTELMGLTGIGPKVADCIALMSLGHLSAIPVDTHIFKIAQDHYCKDLKQAKTVTTKIYNSIGDHFREVYGDLAGWAQTILFCADLKQFEAEDTGNKKPRKRKAQ